MHEPIMVSDPSYLLGVFLSGVLCAVVVCMALIPVGSHLMHVRLRTRRFDFEFVTGYGLSPSARVRFGERIRERREEALDYAECSTCLQGGDDDG